MQTAYIAEVTDTDRTSPTSVIGRTYRVASFTLFVRATQIIQVPLTPSKVPSPVLGGLGFRAILPAFSGGLNCKTLAVKID
jgi:hypothetical protein